MKRRLLTVLAVLFIFSSHVFADNEVVKAQLSNTQTTNPSELGQVHACEKVPFIVTFTIPAGYNRVKKYEWYFNGVLVYTGTDSNNPNALISMDAGNGPTVTCKVTYVNDLTNAVSAPYTAQGFTPQVSLTALNDITQTGAPVLGCPGPVSFSTSVASGDSKIYTPPPSDYTINWTLPAGWSFSSGGTGTAITANSDGVTTGNVAAVLQMKACPYSTVPRTFPVSYTVPSPTLSSSNPPSACNSTQTYSVDAMCGAVSYTYTISQNAGCVFQANGQQTLTTTATSAVVSLPAGYGNFSLSVMANYPNNQVSQAVGWTYYYGKPQMIITITKQVGLVFMVSAPVYKGAYYTWKLNNLASGGGIDGTSDVVEITCGVNNPLTVVATGACGTTNTATKNLTGSCTGGGPKLVKLNVSPNPVQGVMRVSLADEEGKVSTTGKGRLVKAARIVDKAGRIVRRYEFGAGVPEASLNTSGLTTDIYILQIFDGTQWVHREIIVK